MKRKSESLSCTGGAMHLPNRCVLQYDHRPIFINSHYPGFVTYAGSEPNMRILLSLATKMFQDKNQSFLVAFEDRHEGFEAVLRTNAANMAKASAILRANFDNFESLELAAKHQARHYSLDHELFVSSGRDEEEISFEEEDAMWISLTHYAHNRGLHIIPDDPSARDGT
jgi:hypothetical protein